MILNYVWLLIVFLILIFAAIPLIPGTILVQTPGPDGWTTEVTNDTVTMTGNVSIHNGGFFAFNNFFFVIKLYDENGTDLAAFYSDKTDLLPGLWIDVPISFIINKSQIETSVLEALLRSEVTFGSLIYFNTNYLFNFRVQAGVKGNTTIGPLIKDLNIDWNNTVVKVNGTNYELDVPYSFDSSAVLAGSHLSISGTAGNSTGMLASVSTNVTLGGEAEGVLVFLLSQDAYDHLSTTPDHLYLDLLFTLNQTSWDVNEEYDWVPPSQRGG